MKKYFAYTRVSTLKQGEKGVSLQEQHAAIDAYAKRHDFPVVQWFEETLTAAKKGRPLFSKMLKRLEQGEAQGVIIHKIDRSARNLRDWSDLGDLIDSGVSVHFANESIDLQTRGGRLSADIQAVVASDYVRNLREETIKGMWGRLKQGLYPWRAPIGYLDTGGGKVKEIDPARALLIRQAFELYASGRYSLGTLGDELWRRGLRNRQGLRITRNGLSTLLHNPFYIGLLRIEKTGEVFQGKHTPLIETSLFRDVDTRLSGRTPVRVRTHDFSLRGLFWCANCKRHLIGELQKGRVYYRCHAKGCNGRAFREDVLEGALFSTWPSFAPTNEWRSLLLKQLELVSRENETDERDRHSRLQAQIGAVRDRLARLIDAFVDGGLDRDSFDLRKQSLLLEQQSLEESARRTPEEASATSTRILSRFELACMAKQSYVSASAQNKRELVISLSSNRYVAGEHVVVEPRFPLNVLENRALVTGGDQRRVTSRTMKRLARRLWEGAKKEGQEEDDRQAA